MHQTSLKQVVVFSLFLSFSPSAFGKGWKSALNILTSDHYSQNKKYLLRLKLSLKADYIDRDNIQTLLFITNRSRLNDLLEHSFDEQLFGADKNTIFALMAGRMDLIETLNMFLTELKKKIESDPSGHFNKKLKKKVKECIEHENAIGSSAYDLVSSHSKVEGYQEVRGLMDYFCE